MNRFILCGLIIASMSCASCNEYDVTLPNNYKLTRTNATEVVIANADNIIVAGPSVQNYAIKGDLIIGISRKNSGSIPSDFQSSIKEGFFIINTRTGYKLAGLSKPEWSAYLHKLNVESNDLQTP